MGGEWERNGSGWQYEDNEIDIRQHLFVFVKDDMGVFRGIHCVGFFFKAKGMFKPGFFFDIPMFFYSFAVRKLQRVITKRKQNGKD